MPALPDGWVASHLEVPRHAAKFPLALELGDEPHGTVYARFEFDQGRLSGATVARMQEHLLNVLTAMASRPEGELDRIEMLGRVEQRSIAQALQGPAAPRPRWTCVADILAHAASLHPDDPALVYGAHSLSYAELVRRARRIGSRLSMRMNGATTVAVLIKDPFARCLAAWSAWMAGLAIVVLDPDYPSARLAACVGTLSDVRVLAETATAIYLPGYDVVLLDTLESHAAHTSGTTQLPAPGDTAYLVFTSGSTGTPKCIVVTQSNVCAMVTACQQRLGAAEARRTLQTAGPSFDAYLFELLTVAADSGTLMLADRPSLLPGPEMVDIMRRHEINNAFFTPSLLACLDPAAFPTLRSVTCAGEVCAPSLAAPWIAAGVRFVHAYRPRSALCARRWPSSSTPTDPFCRWARPCLATASICWTRPATRCRLAPSEKSASPDPAWQRATWAMRPSPRPNSWPTRGTAVGACTSAATSDGSTSAASWSSSGATTLSLRCVAYASRRPRSNRHFARATLSRRRSWSR